MKPEVLESYRKFWNLLPKSVEANLKFAQEIIRGKDHLHTTYFWGEYSEPILSYIIINALKRRYASKELLIEYSGDYYDFVAGPFEELTLSPNWYQLQTYKGKDGKKLKGWLQNNGYQYFIKKEQERKKVSNAEAGSLDKLPLDILLCFDIIPEGLSDQDMVYLKALKTAWEKVNVKNKEILNILVVSKTHWTDAWDELNGYIDPEEDTEPMSAWSSKKKQDSIARLKRRAKKQLRDIFFEELNKR